MPNTKSSHPRKDSTETLTHQIIEYVRANPGCARADVIAGIGFEGPALQITTMFGRLKRQNVLTSRGPYPKLNRWYPVETTSSSKYQELAREILEELQSTHHEMRQDRLAKLLEEHFS